MDRAQQTDWTGRLLGGRYRVQRALEDAGTGTLYEAADETTGATVSLKVLPEAYVTPEGLEKLRQETDVVTGIGHPHIAKVLAVEQLPVEPALVVFERLAGTSWKARLTEEAPLPPSEVGELAEQLLSVLGAVHAERICHGGLKPECLWVSRRPDGTQSIQVLDFGMASLAAALGQNQRAPAGFGTPDYMAPEQARGKLSDARTDLYAVGAMLYHALGGSLPYEASSPTSMLYAILVKQPRPIEQIKPDLPSELVDLIHQALARHPSARFASAAEMTAALGEWTKKSRPFAAPPPEAFGSNRLALGATAAGTPLTQALSPIVAPAGKEKAEPGGSTPAASAAATLGVAAATSPAATDSAAVPPPAQVTPPAPARPRRTGPHPIVARWPWIAGVLALCLAVVGIAVGMSRPDPGSDTEEGKGVTKPGVTNPELPTSPQVPAGVAAPTTRVAGGSATAPSPEPALSAPTAPPPAVPPEPPPETPPSVQPPERPEPAAGTPAAAEGGGEEKPAPTRTKPRRRRTRRRRSWVRGPRVPRVTVMNTNSLYSLGWVHKKLNSASRRIRRCYRARRLDRRAAKIAGWRIALNARGTVQSVRGLSHARLSRTLDRCMRRVLSGIPWGSTRLRRAGNLDIYFTSSK